MNNKYFTSKSNIIILYGTNIPVIVIGLCLIPSYPQILWFIIGYIAFILAISVLSFYHPIINEKQLIIKHSIFRFNLVKFKFDEIEKIKIFFGAYQNLGLKIKLKHKDKFKFFPLTCMEYKSIKPFVEELRSKGVQVECEPYQLDNGRMIYL